MKKLISVILVFVTVLSCAVFGAYAEETMDKNKRRLELFVNYYNKNVIGMVGEGSIYDKQEFFSAFYDAEAVLNSESSTSEDYRTAYETAKNKLYNMNIDPFYAYKTYQKASALKNICYPEEEWNIFQNALSALKTAIDDNEGISYYYTDYDYETDTEENKPIYKYTDEQERELTKRFHETLYAYNSIADKYYVMGDFNRDGKADVLDAFCIQKAKNNPFVYRRLFVNNSQLSVGDVNGDGKIDVLDAADIQKYSVGKLAEFKPYVSYISKVYTHESEEFMKAHLINFEICPFISPDMPVLLDKMEYISREIQGFYTECISEGIEY